MNTEQRAFDPYTGFMRWGVVIGTVSLVLLLASFSPDLLTNPTTQLLTVLAAVGMSALAYGLTDAWLIQRARQRRLHADVLQAEQQSNQLLDRLTVAMEINRRLADVEDEPGLMNNLLDLLSRFLGAEGASYIPMDEWGQPLASVVHGEVPPATLSNWADYTLSPEVRDRCRNCQILHAQTGSTCPLGGHPFQTATAILCFHLRRSERQLGLLSFYLPQAVVVTEETEEFVRGILGQIAFAVENLRLRNQELLTLRQLQQVRNPHLDLSGQLANLVNDAQSALETDFAMLTIPGSEKTPPVTVYGGGDSQRLAPSGLTQILDQASSQTGVLYVSSTAVAPLPEGVGAVLAVSLRLPDRPTVGVLVFANERSDSFYPRQLRVMETVSSQAVLLVENNRLVQELEYKAVIDERTRLAREIHDGLAQMLAFLKLQVAQMQKSLARNDMAHLEETLRISHQILAEAYLDARQAIDNLRIDPRQGMRHWLEQAAGDLRTNTELQVSLHLSADPTEIAQEVQVQLIRVVQEALANIRKHAKASEVAITVRKWQQDFILEIADNGIGFSSEEIPSVSQYGLRGMRERAELIGADFQIISQPHQGTTVRLRLPYPLEETPV